MNGWILYKNDIKESYETQRLIEEFEKQDFKVRVVNPQDVDIFVDRDDRKSILVASKSSPPGKLIPCCAFLSPDQEDRRLFRRRCSAYWFPATSVVIRSGYPHRSRPARSAKMRGIPARRVWMPHIQYVAAPRFFPGSRKSLRSCPCFSSNAAGHKTHCERLRDNWCP